MAGGPVPGDGQRGGDVPRPGAPSGRPAGAGGGYPGGAGSGLGGRPAGGGDWWPAEDFEEPWPDDGALLPPRRRPGGRAGGGPAGGRDAVPAASPGVCPATGPGGVPAASPKGVLGGGLDAGFLSRDPVPGRPPRSGFSSGGGCDTALPGPVLARSLEAATGAGHANLDDDELIGVLAGWAKTEAWAAAGRLAAAAELAARRPAETRAGAAARAGRPATWSKYCADELAVALSISRRAAERMIPLADDLATRLPRTRHALAAGVIGDYKAQLIAEATRVLDDAAAAEAEAAVVPGAVTGKTPGQIRAAIGRAVLKADPEAARRRRREAEQDPRVELWREDAGTAAICGYGLPPDAALAADQAITAAALALKTAGTPGTTDQLRARAYLDALLGMDSRPTPTADPSTNAPGTAAPGAEPPGAAARETKPGGAGAPGAESGGAESGGAAAGPARPAGPPRPAAAINLTIPLTTLLGLTGHPGEAAGYGPIDADLARTLAGQATGNPATTWCITITDHHGHPTAHGCATPRRRDTPPRAKNPRRRPPGTGSGPPGTRSPRTGSGPPGTGSGPPGTRSPRTGSGPSGTGGGPSGTGGGPSGTGGGPSGTGGGPSGTGSGPPGGYGTWQLQPPGGGPALTARPEPLAITECDHRHQTTAHDPGKTLRHLVQIRDGHCTYPPCLREARRCDFEHAIPWETGGRTCACNTGPRCRHHHHVKQAPGWTLQQNQPGYHTWTTPAGRRYTTGPITYPI